MRIPEQLIARLFASEALQKRLLRAIAETNPQLSFQLNDALRRGSNLPKEKAERVWGGLLEQSVAQLSKSPEIIAEFWKELMTSGEEHLRRGEYPQAEEVLQHAVWVAREVLRKEYLTYTASLSSLSGVYWHTDELGKAEEVMLELLECDERTHGKRHINYATTLHNLGTVQRKTNRLDEAAEALEETLEIAADVSGPETEFYGECLGSLALVCSDRRQYHKAERMFLDAMGIQRRTVGQHHESYAVNLHNLGVMYGNMKRFEEGVDHLKEALVVRGRLFGTYHRSCVDTMESLAGMYRDMGLPEEARAVSQEITRATGRSTRRDVIERVTDLTVAARAHQERGAMTKAEELFEEACELAARELGPDDINHAVALNNLAGLKSETGDLPTAADLFRRALAIFQRLPADQSSYVVATTRSLVSVLLRMGKTDEAASIVEDVEAILRKLSPTMDVGRLSVGHAGGGRADARVREAAEPVEEIAVPPSKAGRQLIELAVNRPATLLELQPSVDSRGRLTVSCQSCGTRTTVRTERFKRRPICGSCGEPLSKETEAKGTGHSGPSSREKSSEEWLKSFSDPRFHSYLKRSLPGLLKIMRGEARSGPEAKIVEMMDALSSGERLRATGRPAEAVPSLERAIELSSEVYGKGSTPYVAAAMELGKAYIRLGRFAQAERLYLECKERLEASLENHDDQTLRLVLGALHNGLGVLYRNLGEYGKAEAAYKRGIRLVETCFGKEHPEYLTYVTNLSALYRTIGDFQGALEMSTSALEIAERLAEGTYVHSRVLTVHADVLQSLGDSRRAESHYLNAMDIAARSAGVTSELYLNACQQLGALYYGREEYDKSEELIVRVMKSSSDTGGEANEAYALSLNNLGAILGRRGNCEEAETLFSQSAEIRREILGRGHPVYAETLYNLACCELKNGKVVAAFQHMLDDIRIQNAMTVRIGSMSSEKQLFRWIAMIEGRVSHALTCFFDHRQELGRFGGDLLTAVLQKKSIVRELASLRHEFLLDSEDEDVARKMEALRKIDSRIAHVVLSATRDGPGGDCENQLRELEKTRNKTEEELRERLPTFNAFQEMVDVTADEIAARLPSGSTLVEFVQFWRHDTDGGDGEFVYAAFLMEAGVADQLQGVMLGARDEIDGLVRDYRRAVEEVQRERARLKRDVRVGEQPASFENASSEVSRRLWKSIWEPLKERVRGVENLIVAPDGMALSRVETAVNIFRDRWLRRL